MVGADKLALETSAGFAIDNVTIDLTVAIDQMGQGTDGSGDGSVYPVLEQERVCNAKPATQIMIDTYMSALGFAKENDEGRYSNGTYTVWDIVPRNVLVDSDGDMYVIDAEIKRI